MNKFHCIEDEEHIKEFSYLDVECVINYCTYFNFNIPPNLKDKADELIKNKAGAAESHQWAHEWIEEEIKSIERGDIKGTPLFYGMNSHLGCTDDDLYKKYLDMIVQTNRCGRDKYKPIDFSVFKDILNG